MSEVKCVKDFWENSPLWTGESEFPSITLDFFEEHWSVYIADCFGGKFDQQFLPPPSKGAQEMRILDLGS